MAVLHARVSSQKELRKLLDDVPVDGLFVLAFDAGGKICGVAMNLRHRSLSWLKVWELAEIASELDASSLKVVVFPSGRATRPSAHECAVFGNLVTRARRAAVPLVDCYVYRGHRMWSLREANELRCA
jgi:hypothetical protein